MSRWSSIRRAKLPVVSGGSDNAAAIVAIVAVFVAVFLGSLDQTVIVTVLPALVVDLQIPFDRLDQAAWIVSGYLLGYTVALPLMGQYADVRGRRGAFILALGTFAVGSGICALAATLGLTIAGRLVQAMGGGALLPVAIAIVSDRRSPSQRALVIGIVGAVAEAGGVLGPLYGAAIVNALSWRWIFWLNLPLAAICLFFTVRGLKRDDRSGHRLDLLGAALAGGSIGALILGLAHESLTFLAIDVRPFLLIASIVVLIAFLVHEARATSPLVDLRLFRGRAYTVAIAGGFLLGVTLIVAMVDVPLYAATVLNLSPGDGGLLLMRLTALIPVGAILGGALGSRLGFGPPTVAGFLVAGLGLLAIGSWGSDPTFAQEWNALAVAGAGFGMLIAPLTTAVVEAVGSDRSSSAAATFTVARLVGMTAGLSVLTSFGLRRFDDLTSSLQLPLPVAGESASALQVRVAAFDQALILAGTEVYHEIFLAAALVCVGGIVVGTLLWTSRSSSGR
jgi:EmrB/QacA subfamily drug resistance transporter